MTPRDKRIQQMTAKGYMQLTPQQRGESMRKGLEAFKEVSECRSRLTKLSM